MRTHLVSTDKNKKDSRIQLFQSNINYAQTQIHACLWVKFMWSLQIFFVKCFENNICSPSMMFLKIISAAWEVFCGVSLRSILNPADSSKHWLSAQSLNILLLGDHFVFPGLTDTVKTSNHVKVVSTTNPQCQEFEKTRFLRFRLGGEGGMRAALSYVTTEEQSASGRVCSLSPTELSWPPETSCFELFLSTSPDAGFLLKVKWLLIVPSWNIQRNFKLKWANSTKVLFV